jgi:hypothetical protein
MKTKLKIDLMMELDKALQKGPDLEAWQIRDEIGRIFSKAAREAGWNFRLEIWPVKREAVDKSINGNHEGLTGKEIFDKEIMDYIEELSKWCQ